MYPLVEPQGFVSAVTAILRCHAAVVDMVPPEGRTHSSFDQRTTSVDDNSHSPWQQQIFHCNFAEGAQGLVEVYPAPVKTVARMLEKLSKCDNPNASFSMEADHTRTLCCILGVVITKKNM